MNCPPYSVHSSVLCNRIACISMNHGVNHCRLPVESGNRFQRVFICFRQTYGQLKQSKNIGCRWVLSHGYLVRNCFKSSKLYNLQLVMIFNSQEPVEFVINSIYFCAFALPRCRTVTHDSCRCIGCDAVGSSCLYLLVSTWLQILFHASIGHLPQNPWHSLIGWEWTAWSQVVMSHDSPSYKGPCFRKGYYGANLNSVWIRIPRVWSKEFKNYTHENMCPANDKFTFEQKKQYKCQIHMSLYFAYFSIYLLYIFIYFLNIP